MNRRRVVLNSVLGVAVVGVGLGAYLSVASADDAGTTAARTVSVSRGTVTATVSATGNAESVTSVGVDLEGSAGVVRKIYVKEGQKVVKGQKLLKIDDAAAKEDLRTAEASLASAEAAYQTTTQGQSAEELAQSNASVRSARTSLTTAKHGLSQAKDTYGQDKKQQAKLVSIAEDGVGAAEDQLDDANQALDDAQQASSGSGTTTGGTTGSTTSVASAQSAVASAKAAVTSAKNTLTQAKQSRDATLLKDRQTIQSSSDQVASAQDALNAQVAAANVAAQPARAGAVKSAQAQIDSAQVSVDKAQQALDETVLRAPTGGTVADISAVKGQSSSSAGSSSSGSSSSSSTGTAAGSASSSSSTSSSSSSGLVTLTNLTEKKIEASVAEADVDKVKVGQEVSVLFSAADKTLKGTVKAIATTDTVTNNVVTYDVTVVLDDDASAVKIGQSATLTITTGSATDVLVAPSAAVTTVGNRSTVTRRVGETDTTVVVETGLVGSTETEVVSGLSEGDTLVIPTSTSSSGTSFPGGGLGGLGGGPR